MELDKNIEQELAELIANPEKVSAHHVAMLNELLQEYPYYQPLHLLLAKANHATGDHTGLAKAALYTNGKVLHRFLFERKSVNAAPREDIVPVSLADAPPVADEQETFEEITEDIVAFAARQPAEEEIFEEIAEVDYTNYRPFSNATAAAGRTAAEAGSASPAIAEPETLVPEAEPATVLAENGTPAESSTTVEPATAEEVAVAAEPEATQELPERKNSLEDNFVFESIVSSDFFAFEDNFSPEKAEEEKPAAEEKPVIAPPPFIEEHDEAAAAEVANGRISNYDDDKLPYTFLWWLAKTRKEHQTIFQPYALPKKEHSQELQQQYVEHIFHMQTHLTGDEALLEHPEQEKPAGRDFEIIESFIKNDPQITPPNAEQIDNENKAKKSAEDQNDLVSETLANIYIEQMLYDKAIETYEKLSLKFPEKSRYFADLIQSIEKKI